MRPVQNARTRHSRLSTVRLTGLVILALAVAGCGGMRHASTAPTAPAPGPLTRVPASPAAVTVAKAWAAAAAARDCAAMSKTALFPIAPARCQAIAGSFPAPQVMRVGTWGVASVADLLLGTGKRSAAVFVLDGARGWRFTNEIATGQPLVGTRPVGAAGARAMLAQVSRAIAQGSCTSVASDFLISTVVHTTAAHGARRLTPANCYGIAGGAFQKLARTRIDSVAALGGTARVTFYREVVGPGKGRAFVVELIFADGTPFYFTQFPVAGVGHSRRPAKAKRTSSQGFTPGPGRRRRPLSSRR